VGFEELGEEYRDALAVFECSDGTPWGDDAEYVVRAQVADALAAPNYAAGIGWFDHGKLLGVAVWRPRPSLPATWEISVLAVSREAQGRMIGTKLKAEVLRRARAAGIKNLISNVDARNVAMNSINEKLDATIRRDPVEFFNRLWTVRVI
jgi:GNAT superfamily N-acetyltransferase